MSARPTSQHDPVAELDARYSAAGATAIPWARARAELAAARLYWLSTVRPEGRPHVTPLIAVWHDDRLHFCTGPRERKARNLAGNAQCVVTTGHNSLDEGLDLVIEGETVQVDDEPTLRALADAYVAKYGEDWRFEVRHGAFFGDGGRALVYGVVARTAFGFGKGDFSQTRWRFDQR